MSRVLKGEFRVRVSGDWSAIGAGGGVAAVSGAAYPLATNSCYLPSAGWESFFDADCTAAIACGILNPISPHS